MTDPDWLGPNRRLAHLPALSQLLRDANREFGQPANEAAAFRKLSARLSASERAFRGLRLALPVAAAALGVVLLLWPRMGANRSPTPLAAAEFPRPVPKTISSGPSREEQHELSRGGAHVLVAGAQRLSDGSIATLDAGSIARVEEAPNATRIFLSRGSIELGVAEQAPGHHFELSTQDYRFLVLGTQFKVQVAKDRVSLEVREGRVAVWKAGTMLARVSAGERWDNLASTTAATSRSSRFPSREDETSQDSSSAAAAPDCLSLARQGSTREAEACFLRRAEGAGIGAEMALYEVARLRRDVLRDPSGALSALERYRERFPAGSLRREADMSHLELLVQNGRSAEALTESSALLASGSARERAAELHLLRGNVFHRHLNDVSAAEREYALGERLTGPASVEATFLRASCLETLGDYAAAATAFERYLERSPAPRSEEAQRRLESLRGR